MKVVIETIPHEQQTYDTCGDWRFEDERGRPITQRLAKRLINTEKCVLRIRISSLNSWKYEMLVAVHELVETLLCLNDGVMVEAVDKFDKAFEAARKEGNEDEPGDDPKAPYVRQHCVATAVERLLCAELCCDWKTYDKRVFSLPTIPSKE